MGTSLQNDFLQPDLLQRTGTFPSCYAPTNSADPEEKDNLYQQLQAMVQKAPKRDMQIVMGDLNAKVREVNTNWKDIMGTGGLGEMNENGVLFADFRAFSELVIGGSLFPHKPTHKATWVSAYLKTGNQIDHISIKRK